MRQAAYQLPSTTADLEPEEAFSEVAAGAAEARATTPERIKAVLMMKAVITSVSTDGCSVKMGWYECWMEDE